jgi:hypothetical protein
MKANAIVFNTENTGEILPVEMNDDGSIIIGESEYFVDKTPPILLKDQRGKGGFIKRRLTKGKLDCYYILKTDTIIPIMHKMEEKEAKFNKNCPKCGTTVATYAATVKTIVPADEKFYKSVMNPRIFKDTAELRFLKQLKKYSEPDKRGGNMKGMLMRILIIVAGGIGAYFIMKQMGVI